LITEFKFTFAKSLLQIVDIGEFPFLKDNEVTLSKFEVLNAVDLFGIDAPLI